MNVRNKAKYLMSAVLAGAIVSLAGCSELEYTEEQKDMIADYAAAVVLKHDVNYKNNYIETSEPVTETESMTFGEDTTTSQGDMNTPSGGSSVETVATAEQLTQALSINGLSAEYSDYYVTDVYPFENQDSALFVMKAVENSKLLVVKFKISNPSGQDIAVNMMAGGRRYRGVVNDTVKVNAQLSLLLDALNTFDGTIPAGTSQEFVLVYQIQTETKEEIKSLVIDIADENGNSTKIKLK